MKTDLLDWDEDQTVDSEEEYQALLNGLKRSQGFGLYFVQCSPFSSGKLIERVQKDLTDQTVSVLKFEQPIADGNVFKRVNAFLREHPSDVLFIQGLENSLAAAEETKKRLGWSWGKIEKLNWREVPLVLNNLNQQRERFRDSFSKTCLVFLLPQYAINYLVHRSPDFFDWRSGVFNYASDPETLASESDRILAEGDYDAYCTWSPEERNKRLLEIQFLLEEHDLRPDKLYLEQGLIFTASEEYEGALLAFDKAAQHDPNVNEAFYNKGCTLVNLGFFEEAIEAYDVALTVNPGDYQALSNKGVTLSILCRYEDSISAYDAALAVNPELHEVIYNKACCYSLQGQIEPALENLEQAIQLNPDKYREMANTDTDFDPIRKDPRFQALVEGGGE